MLRTGVDIIEIERIRSAVARHGDHFLLRVYTPQELSACERRIESLAARFAAKEAAAKALGTGIWRHQITWQSIEIVRDPASGAPSLHLHDAAAPRPRTGRGFCRCALNRYVSACSTLFNPSTVSSTSSLVSSGLIFK
jgi:holo-[acyl-carrier protein] synthase